MATQLSVAQTVDYEIRYIGFREGLKDRSVTAICHSQDGIVWIGTATGLFRYDGYEFMPVNLLDEPAVWCKAIEEDANHNLWVCTKGNSFLISPDLPQPIRYDSLYGLEADEKKQIYGSYSNHNVFRLEATKRNGKTVINKTMVPLKGASIFKLPGKSGIWGHQPPRGTVEVLKDGQVHQLSEGLPANFWFYYLNYGDGVLNDYPIGTAYALDSGGTFKILPEVSKDINNPFFLKDLLNDFLRKNPAVMPPGIAGLIPLPNCVESDRYGNLWVGTQFGLFIVMKRHSVFRNIKVLDSLSIRALYKDGQTLLVAGGNRVNKIDLKTGNIIGRSKKFGVARVILPLDEKKLLLAGDFFNLRTVDRNSLDLVDMFCEDRIGHQSAGVQLASKEIWLGGLMPVLWRFNPQNPDKPIVAGKEAYQIKSIVEGAGGKLWAGGQSQLFCIKNGKVSNNLFPGSIKNVLITCMLELGGTLWLGTFGQGLFQFDIRSGKVIRDFKMEDGLPNDILNCMLLDRNAHIWISTNQGLSRFDPQTRKFLNFSERDGLPIEEFNMASSLSDPETGLLYFGGLNGLIRFDPLAIEKTIVTPEVFISKILRSGLEEGKTQTIYPNKENTFLELEANARFVEFHLGSTDYSMPQQNIFRHKLEGFDNQWVSMGNNPVVQYSNLPAGDYVFCTQTINPQGAASPDLRIHIHVPQMFYKTRLFLGLMMLLLVGIALVYYLNKIRQIKQIIQIKKQISDDLHDDVAASLSQISVLTKSLREKETADATLERIETLSDESIGKLGDIVWAIDDKPQTLEALANRLQDHAEAVLFPLRIRLKADIRIAEAEGSIASPIRHHVMMIFKEAISNIVKHTDSTLVVLNLENQRKELMLIVENTFVEIRKDAHSSGKGLISMDKRAKLLNGILKLEKTEHSFRLVLQVPDIFEKKTL